MDKLLLIMTLTSVLALTNTTADAADASVALPDGNIYVAIYGQGRIMVFNPTGFPTGQYLPPGRDQGHNLRSTSMVIRPGTDELLILINDWDKGQGSTIFAARALARAAQ
ncbi:hypothetical protein ABVB72_23405 [Rhizobium nepotum]|uniref:hypothetical protein n=1 Tax=Rhizobium nepotum TaxID=1035271 RepID=UPI00336A56C0